MPRLPREQTFLPIIPIDPPAPPGPLDPAFADPLVASAARRPTPGDIPSFAGVLAITAFDDAFVDMARRAARWIATHPNAFAVFDPTIDPRLIPAKHWPSLKVHNAAIAQWFELHPDQQAQLVLPAPAHTTNPQPHQRKRTGLKYALTGARMPWPTPDSPARVLSRIVATASFADVVEGDMGGWIESETNLSHDGDCWVYDNGKVYGGGQLQGDAQVRDEAIVRERARVYSHAVVRDRAIAEGDAVVCAWSTVKGTARVTGHARVYSHATVDGDTVCDWNVSGRTPRKPWSRKD